MRLSRRGLLIAGAVLPVAAALPAAATDSVIDVSLWDDPDKDMATGLGYGMGGDLSTANMGIRLSRSEAPAGPVTFDVVNDSKDLVHEMVVSPVTAPGKPLPFDADLDKVIEDAAGHLGEVAEPEPDQKGALTLDLKPGLYNLYCNIPGHYSAGMWTLFTVT